MQENEKYGVELVADTNLFKRGLKELTNYTKAFGKAMKESFIEQTSEITNNFKQEFKKTFNINNLFNKGNEKYKVDINPEMSLKDLEKARDLLEKYLNDAIENQKFATTPQVAETYNNEIEIYGAKLKAVNNRIEELKGSNDELNESLEKTKKTSKNINLGSLFDNSIRKIKRFTYYLLGARSVFSLFMKYQSIYYQYNEKMQYQSELSQNAIALSLAPSFEFLGNVMAYASIGLAKFIELLTGVNVLSKVTTKGIREYNKSLKETQTLVSGVDEITNLTNPQTLGLADQYKALDKFRDKIAEVEEFFSKNEWLGKIADGLKLVWKYLEENIWPVIKDKIWPFVDEYIFPIIQDIVDLIGDAFDLVVDIFDKLGIFDYVVKPILGIIKMIVHLAKFIIEAIDAIFNLDLNAFANASKNFIENVENDWNDIFKKKYTIKADFTVNDKKDFEQAYEKLKEIKEGDYGEIIIDFGGERKFNEFQRWLKDTKKDADLLENSLDYTTIVDDNAKKFQRFQKQIDDWQIDKKVIDVSLKYNVPKKQVQELLDKARWLSVKVMGMNETRFDNLAMQVMKKFGYAKGLDYVPYDNYPALLHKGEAVVPAQYNPTIHSQGNEYTNSLLETLIVKVEDLANRPNEFNVDGKKLARATYPLLQEEGRNYSYNEGVIRNG